MYTQKYNTNNNVELKPTVSCNYNLVLYTVYIIIFYKQLMRKCNVKKGLHCTVDLYRGRLLYGKYYSI